MSTIFTINAEAMINSALRKQGWLDYQETADPTKLADMLEALNIMIKAWSSNGLKVWTIEDAIPAGFTMIANQPAFAIGPSGADITADRPERIEFMLLRNTAGTSNDINIWPMARTDYLLLGDKFTAGTPSSFFYDPQLPNGIINLYNPPSAAVVSQYLLHIYERRYIEDINSLTDYLDFPTEWIQCLVWNLADETAEENQIPEGKIGRINKKAMYYKEEMESWDREWTDVTFGLDRMEEAFR